MHLRVYFERNVALHKVGDCIYRNAHGVYFAWFSVRGKQVKRSLKTNDRELARRRLVALRQNASRLHGSEYRNLRFEELGKLWLESTSRPAKQPPSNRPQGSINH